MLKSSLARAFQKGNAQGVQLVIDVPTRFQDIAKRHHNRFVKESLRQAMDNHQKNVIPGHFEGGAHAKYGYATRAHGYIAMKTRLYGNAQDLVKTGNSRSYMTKNYTITIGGAAEGGKPVRATLSMRFPFVGGTGAQKEESSQQHRNIDIRQMIHEMQAMTDKERSQIASDFWNEYCNRVRNFRGQRKRVRMPNNTSNFARPAAWGEL